jgi:hypothetical protein
MLVAGAEVRVPPSDTQAPQVPDQVQLLTHSWLSVPRPNSNSVLPSARSAGAPIRCPAAPVRPPVDRFRSQNDPSVPV